MINPPGNISSRTRHDWLLQALTNPTSLAYLRYPVTDKTGKVWPDAEAAYKHYKRNALPFDQQLMVRIIMRKLQQHPELVAEITKRGGSAYLEQCWHLIGVRGSRWEGKGRDSRFICALIQAYFYATVQEA